MGTVRKVGERWRAEVCVGGQRASKRFDRKTDAQRWIAIAETDGVADTACTGGRTLLDAFRRYASEESPHHRGSRWELVRLKAFESPAHSRLPIGKPVAQVQPSDLALWRDARLKVVAPGTVLREMTLVGCVLEAARRNWRWCQTNPARDVRKPSSPRHREVVITRSQTHKVLRALGYSALTEPRTVSQVVGAVFLLALRTGMRAGELCALNWPDIVVVGGRGSGYARLHVSKTGDGRDVPLTRKSVRLIGRMRSWDAESVFAIQPSTLDALFRRARTKAGLANAFTFHDSRHTAATWIAGRLKSGSATPQQALMDLCKIFGWRDVSRALTYYNPAAADVAERL